MSVMELGKWFEILSATENLGTLSVSMDGSTGITQFALPPGWNVGIEGKDGQDVTTAKMGTAGGEYSLTKEAILEICHSIGLTPKYVMRTPGPLIQSHLNYWATHSPDTDLRLLVDDEKVARIVAKQGIVSFSNTVLLERVVDTLEEQGWFEEDVLVDQKSHHDLGITVTRLVLQSNTEVHDGDVWASGIQLTNSLIGSVPLAVQGYLYNQNADAAAITQFTEGRYNRKTMGQDFSEVLEWMDSTTKLVCEMLPQEHETLDHAAEESIVGSVSPVLADIFKTYKVPLKVRQPIMDMLIESENFTYYGIVDAISKSACYDGLPPHFVTNLMEIAGDIAKHASERCDSCKRVLS